MTVDAWLFAAAGTVQAGLGAFFIFVRPPLLPEDQRFLGQTTAEIDEHVPRLGNGCAGSSPCSAATLWRPVA